MSQELRAQLQATLTGTHTLEQELGGGGMSKVFLAEETRLGRKVVVKVLSPELAEGLSVERFEREIRTAAALQQANIVPVLGAGDTNGLPFYTMPYVAGESLRARLGKGPLAISEVVSVMRDVARALAYAHRQGVVHRDIKPDNVLLSEGAAVVTDFGIAKAISAARTAGAGATLTQVGTSIGTPAYMAPEQAAGDPGVDHRADIYALGATAYELLTGRAVFADRSPQRMLAAHMGETPVPVTELRTDTPPQLADLVMRCLAKDAAERPRDAGEIQLALEAVTGAGFGPATGGPRSLRAALVRYAVAVVAVVVLARAAIVGIGLPGWVLPGAFVAMALGLPVLFRQRSARGAAYALGAFGMIVAAFMAMRGLGIGPFGSLLATGELNAQDRVLIADFTVSGGDTTLGRVVSDAVRAGLRESSAFSVVDQADVAAALERMARPVTTRVDLATAREIAQREGFKAVIDGDVAVVGGSYILAVRLVTGDSARELASARAAAASADKLIDASDQVSRELRGKAGESLRRVQNAPALALATTGSLEALRKYSEAYRLDVMHANALSALPLYREAVAIDTMFVEAWARIAFALFNARIEGFGGPEADAAITRAYELRDRVGPATRDRIIASYFRSSAKRDRAKAIAAYDAILARGDSDRVRTNLAWELLERREFARAETLLRADVRQDTMTLHPQVILIQALAIQGKVRAADSAIAVDRRRSPGRVPIEMEALRLLKTRGRLDAFERGLDSARAVRNPVDPTFALRELAGLAFEQGRVKRWQSLDAQRRQLDSTLGRRQSRLNVALNAVGNRALLGLPVEAELKEVDAVLREEPIERMPASSRPYLNLAVTYALAQRPDRSRALMARHDAEVTDPAVRTARRRQVDFVESIIARAEGRWGDAIARMRAWDRDPDGPAQRCGHCLATNLIWMFAEAGMADSALAEYEAYRAAGYGARERDGPDVEMGAPPMAAIARIYEMKGDTANAVALYREFIELWKDADPELQPQVAAARERLRALTPVERPRR
ncbi:MAG: protein kinase [Gemmatimonadetes bacterium]|nr:protein kinase [Gemmatimonadota bacterium]